MEPAHDNGRPHTDQPPRISTDPDPSTGHWLIIAVAALVVLLVSGFAIALGVRLHHDHVVKSETDAAADAAATVEVVDVKATAATYPLSLPGSTAGWYESPLFARVDGYVQSWSANIGDHVKAGQVLAVIDTPELKQQLMAAQAKANASRAMVDVAKSNVSIAGLINDRYKAASKQLKELVSEQEQQQKQADYDSAVAHEKQAEAQAQDDEAEVDRYTAMENFRRVTAPYDGIIRDRPHCDIGQLVTAGSNGGTMPLYTMAQYETIRVFVYVPQKAGAAMTAGLHARVDSDQYPGRPFDGTVAFVAGGLDPETRTLKVEVDIANHDLALKPGLKVEVTFDLNQHGLLEVPAAAILFKPGGLQVAVVNAHDKVEFRPVTVAKDNGDTVELATGVQAGDRVALNISTAIAPGQQVKVEQAPPEAAGTEHPSPMVETTGVKPAGPSGPGKTVEPGPTPSNRAPPNKPGGGVGGD